MARKQLVLSRNADPKTLNAEQRRYIREDLGFVNKTFAEWLSENPVLGEGEQGYDKDRKAFKIGDGVTAWNELPYIVNGETQTALDVDARLAGSTPAGTYVEQTDVPNVIFFQAGADASDPDSWIALPASKEADGSFIVDMTLADVTGTVPDLNQLGNTGGILTVGDGITEVGRKAALHNPARGMARFVAINDGSVGLFVSSTTDFICVRWWDGSLTIVGDGTNPAANRWVSKSVPTGVNAWAGSSPKEIYIWSCTGATDATKSGDLTHIRAATLTAVDIDISTLSALKHLDISNDGEIIPTLDYYGLTQLEYLALYQMGLTRLPLKGLTNIYRVSADDNNLTEVDFREQVLLDYVSLRDNPNLSTVHFNPDNTDAFTGLSGGYLDIELKRCNLDAAALNYIYENLPPATSGITIYVFGNPGVGDSAHDPSLAPPNWTVDTTTEF